jgi:uncharacterized protein (DUF58 family)
LKANKIRPRSSLVHILAAAAVLALMALPLPSLVLPAITLVAIVTLLAGFDWAASRQETAPQIKRIFPRRMVKGRVAELVYQITPRDGVPTIVSALDELPRDLGGDWLIDDIPLTNGPVELRHKVVPLKRGLRKLGPIYVGWRSRIGLWQLQSDLGLGGETVAILPRISPPARRISFTDLSLYDQLGVRPKAPRGEGLEFESMREYVRDDDARHIDWHASARRGRIMVRQYQIERHHTVIVAIDCGRLMAAPVAGESKLDQAVECAIALARACAEFGDLIGFVAFDRELRLLVRPGSGRSGIDAAIDGTLELQPRAYEPDYRVLVDALAHRQSKRSLVIVLTDLSAGSASRELETALRILTRRHCVMLVAVRDKLISELDRPEPRISLERFYRRLALQDLALEREVALRRIQRCGIQIMDLDPQRLTTPVLNRYFAIRQAGLV